MIISRTEQSAITVDPTILLHPNIPKPLHLVNPRSIFGDEWWNTNRRIAYASNNFHCAACGIHKYKALFYPWLEAHECYDFDYNKGTLTFIKLHPLCHACHNYIHSGRLSIMYRNGTIDREKYKSILAHGDKLVRGLAKPEAISSVRWEDWRMVINGKSYPPKLKSYAEWCRHFGIVEPLYSALDAFNDEYDYEEEL